MKHITIKRHNSIDLTSYPEFLFLLENVSSLVNETIQGEWMLSTYELIYESDGDDLNIDITEKSKDLMLHKILAQYMYDHAIEEVTYKTKKHKGILGLFERAKEITAKFSIKEIYQYLQHQPEYLLYEHRMNKVLKKYLNATYIKNEEIVKVYEVMYAARLFDLVKTNFEDVEVYKLRLNY